MTERTRKFGGERYTYACSRGTKWKIEGVKDRMTAAAHDGNASIKFRIVKRTSRAPPQGDVYYDLYYRKYGHGAAVKKKW